MDTDIGLTDISSETDHNNKRKIMSLADYFQTKKCGNTDDSWLKHELLQFCSLLDINCTESNVDSICNLISRKLDLKRTTIDKLDYMDIDVYKLRNEFDKVKIEDDTSSPLEEEEWDKYASKFKFDDNYYPTEQSPEKKHINSLFVKFIEKSGIPHLSQKALILDSLQLNTINALLDYNKHKYFKVIVPECVTETCYNMSKRFYDKYGTSRAHSVEFYPGYMLNADFLNQLAEADNFPNIVFADFTDTYHKNVETINTVLKHWQHSSHDSFVLCLTFSMRGEHHVISKYNCGTATSDINVMNCVTNELLKSFGNNNLLVKHRYRLKYNRTLPNGKRSGRMSFYAFVLNKPRKGTNDTQLVLQLQNSTLKDVRDFPIDKTRRD